MIAPPADVGVELGEVGSGTGDGSAHRGGAPRARLRLGADRRARRKARSSRRADGSRGPRRPGRRGPWPPPRRRAGPTRRRRACAAEQAQHRRRTRHDRPARAGRSGSWPKSSRARRGGELLVLAEHRTGRRPAPDRGGDRGPRIRSRVRRVGAAHDRDPGVEEGPARVEVRDVVVVDLPAVVVSPLRHESGLGHDGQPEAGQVRPEVGRDHRAVLHPVARRRARDVPRRDRQRRGMCGSRSGSPPPGRGDGAVAMPSHSSSIDGYPRIVDHELHGPPLQAR